MESGAFAAIFLALILLFALVHDIKCKKVSNKLILIGLVSGFGMNSMPVPVQAIELGFWPLFNPKGISAALLGTFVGLCLFLPFYAMGGMGAGDVKLMAVVGSFVGPAAIPNIALFVLLAGGVLCLLAVLILRERRVLIENFKWILYEILAGKTKSFDAKKQSVWRVPYVTSIALGVLAYVVWLYSGFKPVISI